MIPHNLCFGYILEMTVLGGRRDPSEGSWGDGRGRKSKKIKILNGLIETIPMIPHVTGLGKKLRFSEIRGGFP